MNAAAVYILGFFGAVFGWLTIKGIDGCRAAAVAILSELAARRRADQS